MDATALSGGLRAARNRRGTCLPRRATGHGAPWADYADHRREPAARPLPGGGFSAPERSRMRPRRSISPAPADSAPIRNYLRFHTGAPISDRKDAAFALGDWEALAPLSDYPLGSDGYPDRSATLIVELPALTAMGARLTGPGIRTHAQLSATGDRCVYRQCAAFSTRAGFSSSPAAMRLRRCRVRHVWRRADVCGGERRRAPPSRRRMTGSRASGAEIRRLRKSASTRSANRWRSPSIASWRRARSTIPDLAALALKQARGDTNRGPIFLIRAYRTTLPRFGASRPIATGACAASAASSAIFKDVPGGQVLRVRPSNYTHRLLDFKLAPKPRHPKGHSPRRRHSRARMIPRMSPTSSPARI